jgi:hypothetical protein
MKFEVQKHCDNHRNRIEDALVAKQLTTIIFQVNNLELTNDGFLIGNESFYEGRRTRITKSYRHKK